MATNALGFFHFEDFPEVWFRSAADQEADGELTRTDCPDKETKHALLDFVVFAFIQSIKDDYGNARERRYM
jgi:hypothetical protein